MIASSPDASAKELVQSFVEILGGARKGKLLDLFADDAWVHTTGSSCVSAKRRPHEFLAMLRDLSTVVPHGLRLEIRSLIGEGDQAACEVLGSSATADGRAYNNHYVFWVRAAQGRIVHLSEFMDSKLAHEIFLPTA